MYVFSVKATLISGTISADNEVNAILSGNFLTEVKQDIGSSLSSTPQRFSVTAFSDAAGNTVTARVHCDVAAVIELTEWQLEEVTAQTIQAPSEYVSTGVLSAPFHGANIDGLKYFNTLNGNTVS